MILLRVSPKHPAPPAVCIFHAHGGAFHTRQHLGLWEESHAPPDGGFPNLEITFDHSYSHIIQRTQYPKPKKIFTSAWKLAEDLHM